MCYPEDRLKGYWDNIVAVTLLAMCIVTPVHISLRDEDRGNLFYQFLSNLTFLLDSIFGIDIIIVFFSSFYNDDF